MTALNRVDLPTLGRPTIPACNIGRTDSGSRREIDGDIGTIGISDHAQAELSDVVFVDLPEVGATVAAGDPVAVVESVKAASDVYTPVSGEILEVNEELSNDPSLINSDPYGAGWLYKIRLDVPTETEDMMNATDYEEYCS